MNDFPILTTSLLDLLYELRDTSVRLIIGGGFGLYLKQQFIAEADTPTLLTPSEARSTQDLDIFLKTEIIAYAEMLLPFQEALARLGYSVVPGAEYYHFARPVQLPGGIGRVKIDLLTAPPHLGVPSGLVSVKDRRVKSRIADGRIHGRYTREAFSLEDHLIELTLSGQRTAGEQYESIVFLPHPFHYLVMKLFAYRDAETKSQVMSLSDDERTHMRRNAIKHAFDLYTILAGTNEQEWEKTKRLFPIYASEAVVGEARDIVKRDFFGRDAIGVLRLRENVNFMPSLELDAFQGLLREAFALIDGTSGQ